MAETWVVNASPLIVLGKAGRLALIDELCDAAFLPDAVATEILAGPADDPARLSVTAGWGRRVSPRQIPASLVEWGLGAGETAVLAVAMEHMPCTALLDDAAGRSAARTLGIPVLGTLGLIVRAKVRGLVPSAARVFDDLRQAGLYLDDSIIEAALRHIGERWQK